MKLKTLFKPLTLVTLLLTPACIIAIKEGPEDWGYNLKVEASSAEESPVEIAIRNRHNLNKLSPGMTLEAVHEIMGVASSETARIANPYRTESFPLESGGPNATVTESRGQVLFYYTENHTRDGRVEVNELTPVWFADGQLLGWGRSAFEIWKSGLDG